MGGEPRVLMRLLLAFPESKAATLETLTTYADELTDIPPALLAQAITVLIRTEQFFPALGRIRTVCAEIALDLPNEAEALKQINTRMRWGQLDEETRGAAPPVHQLAADALQQVGGFYTLRTAEQPGVILGQWGRIYRELRAGALRHATIGQLPELPAGAGPVRLLASSRAQGYPASS